MTILVLPISKTNNKGLSSCSHADRPQYISFAHSLPGPDGHIAGQDPAPAIRCTHPQSAISIDIRSPAGKYFTIPDANDTNLLPQRDTVFLPFLHDRLKIAGPHRGIEIIHRPQHRLEEPDPWDFLALHDCQRRCRLADLFRAIFRQDVHSDARTHDYVI